MKYLVPESLAVKLPQEIPPILGVFTANLEAALNCVLDCGIRIGESVAIFGQGVIGLLITYLVRRCGVNKILTVDRVGKRRALSQKLGADFTLDPDKNNPHLAVRELTNGVGADVVIEASGSPEALDFAIKSAAFQGLVVVMSWYGTKPVILHLGEEFHRNRIKMRSSQVSHIDPALTPRWSVKRRMDIVLKLLPQFDLSQLISHVYPFEEAQRAYEKVDKDSAETLQVVLNYV
jgi:threonine dehydrogenase-like Zn-dependent dehydrogenase